MALDPSEQFSPFAFGYTPSNIATLPEATLKSMRDYGTALSTGSGQQPVKHWTQGLSNIVNAYMGGRQQAQADAMERARIAAGKSSLLPSGYAGGAPGAAAFPTPQPPPPVAAPPAPASGVPGVPGVPGPTGTVGDNMMNGIFGPTLA